MTFLSTKEIAKKWGIDTSLVLRLAREGRIEGAVRFGNKWMFPPNVKKPADGRTRSARAEKKNEFPFRFPMYLDFEESTFFPPLSEEEQKLRKAQIDFHACRFEQAGENLLFLSKNARNRYVRISALYHLSFVSIYENIPDFNTTWYAFNMALKGEFPYKKEMMLLRYLFDANMGYYKLILEEFYADSEYYYHPSSYSTLLLASLLPIENGNFALLSQIRYDTYEVLCQQLEHQGHFCEAQKLHYLLLIVYQLKNAHEKMLFHIRKGLEIAFERKLYWYAAIYEQYYPDMTHRVLSEFPEDFSRMICSLGDSLHKKMVRFEMSHEKQTFLTTLTSKEFEYAFWANQGFSNKQIAKKMNISEKAVSKHYCAIYEKLGVKSRKELIELINRTHKSDMF